MSHFRDQGAHSLYGLRELQVVMSDAAGDEWGGGLSPSRWSKWQVQPATGATYRKHREAARLAAFRSLVHFMQPLPPSDGDVLRKGALVGGGGGRLTDSWYRCIGGIKQQLCQCSSLQISSERGWDPQSRPADFTMTGLTGSSGWFSQILWLNNSVIHTLSAFKAPIPSFKSLPFGQGTLFFSIPFRFAFFFFFFAAFGCSSAAARLPALPSSHPCTSA